MIERLAEIISEYKGEPVEGEIAITTDSELVTINGATITAGANAGSCELTVAVNGISFKFNVIVTSEICLFSIPLSHF